MNDPRDVTDPGRVPETRPVGTAHWMTLLAAFLGWMFDGLEMGLFPLVARPALQELLGVSDEQKIGLWFSIATALFLIGAATGGVLFGWLGDRIGRVRAMMASVLTYAIFSGLCGFATAAWHIAVLRFISALGMGGEWSLGVALVMEIWPNRSRGVLAGLIGAAANCGFLLIALLGRTLTSFLGEVRAGMLAIGLPEAWITPLLANSGWRLLMLVGAVPALLTFFIRLLVPESERWLHEKERGATSHWAARDLLGVLVGALGACSIVYLWAMELGLTVRLVGTLVALCVTTVGYIYPVLRYLVRSEAGARESAAGPILGRMMLAACLSGVALLGTWGSLQWAAVWADALTGGTVPQAKADTQTWSAIGAIIGTMGGAMIGNWLGRRATYALLCLLSLGSALAFFQLNQHYGPMFLFWVCIAGGMTASFYGWLPLYLPELFPTRVRAIGQGFSFNFGRIVAAVGALQTGNLMGYFERYQTSLTSEGQTAAIAGAAASYPLACSVMSLIYLVGLAIIWLAPETRGKPLPD